MTTPTPWWRCIVGWLLAACLTTTAGAAEKWLRLEADGVTVYSEASAGDATEFLMNYLGYRRTFETLFGRPDRTLAPVHVLLFKKRAAVGKIQDEDPDAEKVVVALTVVADGDVILALSVDGDRRNALRTVFEFDTISGLQRAGYFLPLWMEQGTGGVLSTLEMEKDSCVVGSVIDWMTGTLGNDKWLPWEKISHIRTNSTDYTNTTSFQMYAAQSWAMMRTVLLREPDKARERFLALVDEIHRTPQADEAVAKVLHLNPSAMAAEIKRMVRQRARIVVPFDRQLARGRIKIDAAPPVEVAIAIADLTLVHGRPEAAEVALQRAIALAPDSPLVLEAMGRRELHNSNSDRAAGYYRAAIEAGATSPRAFVLSAKKRLDDAIGFGREQPGQGGTPVVEALAELRQALKMNPGDGQAYVLLGRALYVSEVLTVADLAEVAPGLNSREYGFWVRYYHALLQLRLDRYAEAVASVRLLLHDGTIPTSKRQALLQDFAAQNYGLVKTRVEYQVRARDFAAAKTLLDQRLSPTEWDIIAEPVLGLRNWVEVSAALDELDQLESNGPADELRKARQAFVAKYPNERAAKQIQEALESEPVPGK